MKVIVIKCGGSTINDLTESFFTSVNNLKKNGYNLVFVHGGGPDINETLKLYNINPEFKNGLRKTTPDVMHIVELVLSGKTNRSLVGMLQSCGYSALGLNGSDCSIFQAEYLNKEKLGQVGKIHSVNKDLLLSLLQLGCTPVITPIAVSNQGLKLNINADMAAGAVAAALKAEMCIFITDVEGVLKDGSLIKELTVQESMDLIEGGTIHGGMIPKVETAISVLSEGAEQVMIASGKTSFYNENRFMGTTFISDNNLAKEAAK